MARADDKDNKKYWKWRRENNKSQELIGYGEISTRKKKVFFTVVALLVAKLFKNNYNIIININVIILFLLRNVIGFLLLLMPWATYSKCKLKLENCLCVK